MSVCNMYTSYILVPSNICLHNTTHMHHLSHRQRIDNTHIDSPGRVVRPTRRNPDPVQDTKDVNFAALSKRKCCNFLPVQDWTKQAVFKTLKMAHKFVFSRIPMNAYEISENYVIKGGEKEKIYGDDRVQDTKM